MTLSSLIGSLIVEIVPEQITEAIISFIGNIAYSALIVLAEIAPFLLELVS